MSAKENYHLTNAGTCIADFVVFKFENPLVDEENLLPKVASRLQKVEICLHKALKNFLVELCFLVDVEGKDGHFLSSG